MGIFVIFRVADPAKIKAAVEAEFPLDNISLDHNEWLVSMKGTAKEVSDKLKISDASNGAAIVFGMSNYFGRAPSDVWDWVKAKAEASDG
jgi:hypothetical protein